MKIALCDKETVFNDININFATMMDCIEEASVMGAEVIVFPESFLTGYSSNPCNICTISEESDIMSKIIAGCKSKRISLIMGFNEIDENRKYLSVLVYDKNNDKTFKYRKTHLGLKEKSIFEEGQEIGIAVINNTTVGINLCIELHIPELFLYQALGGASLSFVLSAFPEACGHRSSIWHKMLPARATDNAMIIIALNAFGYTDNGAKLEGGAAIVGCDGEFKYENYDGNRIHLVDIDFEALIKRKQSCKLNYPLRRRKELFNNKEQA
ncbi:MAG: carbon-nitrogen hydrolase family protein [Tissierellales bacterium]|nr:carbon-nitrogen hydrolase family protein [Tissierellales bacterium]MBN2827878.1 carbon-nitrogen hydrolase family protein [Tissierellales bacterium]